VIVLAALGLLAQLLLGWLLADFLSGVLHWIEDRFGPGREHWPLLGALIFTPNIIHHADPTAFLRTGFVERNWTTWAAVAPIAVLMLLAFGPQPWVWSAAIGGAMASEIHAWAHRKTMAPRWALPLQSIGLLQSPRHHAVHHVPDHRRHYCIISDLVNPVLDHFAFWFSIEKLLPRGLIR
jgi:ubiquitin-conjugating enzyme E2 variant